MVARRKLRSGFTTGACAAAAAKGAALLLLGETPAGVTLRLPWGARDARDVRFTLVDPRLAEGVGACGVVKDAGDDPDVTDGVEVCAAVSWDGPARDSVDPLSVTIAGGEGVGRVTKPGLAVPPGQAAINPVPRAMIEAAVREALNVAGVRRGGSLRVSISVPRGEEVARKTLNARLGIVGGISILGTTGIVIPMSADAWRATIDSCLDVARAAGLSKVVLAHGRSSEAAARLLLPELPPEAFVLMGDHVGYALDAAADRGVGVVLAGQFAKFCKVASGLFETHVKDSSLDLGILARLLEAQGAEGGAASIRQANTAREVFEQLHSTGDHALFLALAREVASRAAERVEGRVTVEAILFGYAKECLARCSIPAFGPGGGLPRGRWMRRSGPQPLSHRASQLPSVPASQPPSVRPTRGLTPRAQEAQERGPASRPVNVPRIHIIGVPPGASALPPEAREAATSCRLLVGARRHLDLLHEFSGEVLAVEGRVGEAVDRVAGDPGLTAAFLASGDPGFFGIAGLMLRRLRREEVRIWPAVSSMQLAFARAGETWSDARFASLHGRPLEALAPVLGAPKLGLFTDAGNSPAAIARFAAEAGWEDLEMVVLEDLGLPSERVERGRPADFFRWKGSALNVVLLLSREPDPRPLGPGLPEEAFSHSRGLITKAEVRAAALGLLRLPREGTLWDVGAGSGSVAVEACLLAPGLRAYAVEKTDAGQGHLAENRRRFRVAGLTPVAGEAPEALEPLPDPDAVFVGGSGGRLRAIADVAWRRLKPGGALVLASVLVESLAEALAWGNDAGTEPELTEIRTSRSRRIADRHALEPQNPVTLIRFTKPPETDRGSD